MSDKAFVRVFYWQLFLVVIEGNFFRELFQDVASVDHDSEFPPFLRFIKLKIPKV